MLQTMEMEVGDGMVLTDRCKVQLSYHQMHISSALLLQRSGAGLPGTCVTSGGLTGTALVMKCFFLFSFLCGYLCQDST